MVKKKTSFHIYLEAQRRWARSNERRRPHDEQKQAPKQVLLVPPSENPNSEVCHKLEHSNYRKDVEASEPTETRQKENVSFASKILWLDRVSTTGFTRQNHALTCLQCHSPKAFTKNNELQIMWKAPIGSLRAIVTSSKDGSPDQTPVHQVGGARTTWWRCVAARSQLR